ncbi:hypothetical protein [Adhaeribacter pallidiroseus]|uniref:Uncharacterized protein n=1 Tax=Adhaeribacter pallidiroseus TaxID=2072847 RepID=A0A369Q2U5_9BACT|nr:hypothetical protein [Adhaeribacter pallidiroseus]RDC58780.1 hypothetical protein AHMF7616_05214 [Adhaeribacter pallidiroseus]
MSTGETILQLCKQHQLTLPFAVRKNTWSREYYVLVEGLDQFRRIATGAPTKQGQLVRIFEGYAPWREERTIPQANQRVWEYVPDADISVYQRGQQEGQVYELHYRLFWGKYKGLSVEEICQEHLDYLEWAIERIEKNFCLSAAAIASLTASGLELDPFILELNQAKLIWYAHGLAEDHLPGYYGYLLLPVDDPWMSEEERAVAQEKYDKFMAEQERLLGAAPAPIDSPEAKSLFK